MNEFTICSNTLQDEMVQETCPPSCGLSGFWEAASTNFAKRSSGIATVILNGTRETGAISNSSVFFKHELPNLEPPRVSKVLVYMLVAPGMATLASCVERKSLLTLQTILATKSIPFECVDNPSFLFYYLCFLSPDASECKRHFLKQVEQIK